MKALSILQPWATLLARGLKRYETRSWKTEYRGPLLIVSSRRFDPEFQIMAMRPPFSHALIPPKYASSPSEAKQWLEETYPLGAIIAKAHMIECWPTNAMPQISDNEKSFGNFGIGRFAWELHNVKRLPAPIPFRGCLGVYDVPDAVLPEEFRE